MDFCRKFILGTQNNKSTSQKWLITNNKTKLKLKTKIMSNTNKKVRFTQESITLKDQRINEKINVLSFTNTQNKPRKKRNEAMQEMLLMLDQAEKSINKLKLF